MNSIRVTPYKIRIKHYDDDSESLLFFDSAQEMLNCASRYYAFHDLVEDEDIVEIKYKDMELEYYGWLPDMEIRFVNKANREEIIWDAFYPEWDH